MKHPRKPSVPDETPPFKTRREALKRALAGGTVLSAAVLPAEWIRPVIRTAVLPAHAQTSPDASDPPAPTLRPVELDSRNGDFEGGHELPEDVDEIEFTVVGGDGGGGGGGGGGAVSAEEGPGSDGEAGFGGRSRTDTALVTGGEILTVMIGAGGAGGAGGEGSIEAGGEGGEGGSGNSDGDDGIDGGDGLSGDGGGGGGGEAGGETTLTGSSSATIDTAEGGAGGRGGEGGGETGEGGDGGFGFDDEATGGAGGEGGSPDEDGGDGEDGADGHVLVSYQTAT